MASFVTNYACFNIYYGEDYAGQVSNEFLPLEAGEGEITCSYMGIETGLHYFNVRKPSANADLKIEDGILYLVIGELNYDSNEGYVFKDMQISLANTDLNELIEVSETRIDLTQYSIGNDKK